MDWIPYATATTLKVTIFAVCVSRETLTLFVKLSEYCNNIVFRSQLDYSLFYRHRTVKMRSTRIKFICAAVVSTNCRELINICYRKLFQQTKYNRICLCSILRKIVKIHLCWKKVIEETGSIEDCSSLSLSGQCTGTRAHARIPSIIRITWSRRVCCMRVLMCMPHDMLLCALCGFSPFLAHDIIPLKKFSAVAY